MNKRHLINLAMILLVCSVTACSTVNKIRGVATTPEPETENNLFEGQIAPLLEGMGVHNFDTSLDDELAAQYFNQAIALTYGFNHLEAGRSFKQVATIDPSSAIAFWGQALVLGPNINAVMESTSVRPAYQAIQLAKSRRAKASNKEKALIDALAKRYSLDESLSDRVKLDKAYANAMRRLLKKYPNDPNIRTLFAESLMVIHSWDYWNWDGRPKEWTPEILSVLERGLEEHPRHAGLIHYYIHAVEASKRPGRALAYADTLRDLVPGAGHLVHMPSHIYIRTGRYQDGVEANEKAIQVDNNYIAQCQQQGIYPVAYVPHNRHFLWAMATMQGNSKKAIKAAEHMAGHIDEEMMQQPGYGTLQHYWVTPLYAYVRFGKWNKILGQRIPREELKYPRGVWHYARGIAFTALGRLEKAKVELARLQALAEDESLKSITVWEINDAQSVLKIAALVLQGELYGKEKNFQKSIVTFIKAITLEDSLNYNEPSDWHYPVRQSLGAVLLESGDYAKAELTFKNDLKIFPENGWSLYGLQQALQRQGKTIEAELVGLRLQKAWQWADIKLNSSRIL